MGVSYTTYVGPYIRCQNTRIGARAKVRGCPNKECPRFAKQESAHFCGTCGTKIEDVEVFVKHKKVSVGDMIEALDQRMTCLNGNTSGWPDKDVDIWTPNVKVEGLRRCWLDEHFIGEQKITAEQITQEMFLLMTGMAPEMDMLSKAYGSENTKLFWGVVGTAW